MRARLAHTAAAATSTAVLAILAAGAADARAATVGLGGPDCVPDGSVACPDELVFSAAPGEVNRLTVRRDADGTVLLHDDGAPVSGCTPVDAQTVRCAPAGSTVVDLGDGDDELAATGSLAVVADGGDGDDRLTGGDAADSLTGGTGDDVLTGGGSADALTGGAGTDELDGGSGEDAASWADHPDGVTADLTTGRGGTAGSEDRLTAIEVLVGGPGDDVLSGGPGPDALDGGAGRDRLDGREGEDVLFGRAGSDVLIGGPGDDDLDAGADRRKSTARRDADHATCGPGRDRIEHVLAAALVGGDCELIAPEGVTAGFAFQLVAAPPRLSGAILRLTSFICYAASTRARCTTRLRVRRGARLLAGRTLVLRDGGNGAGTELRLDGGGRTVLRSQRRVRVRVEVRGSGCSYSVCAFRTTLRAR